MKKLLTPLALGLLMIVLLLGGIAAVPSAANDNVRVVVIAEDAAITADTTYPAQVWLSNVEGYAFEMADIFYEIDQTDVNTITLNVQASPDQELWIAHADNSGALVAANVADASSYKQFSVDGRFFRVIADVANTNTVTITVKAVLH